MPKNKSKPDWQLTFTISSEPKLAMDGQVMHKATALARRGDFAYMAELELVNWSEDIAAFFEKVRSVFFDAEVNGLPDFPEISEASPVPELDEDPPPVEEPTAEADNPLGEDEYNIEYYPVDTNAADVDETQPTLF